MVTTARESCWSYSLNLGHLLVLMPLQPHHVHLVHGVLVTLQPHHVHLVHGVHVLLQHHLGLGLLPLVPPALSVPV